MAHVTRIGGCRVQVNPEQVVQLLESKGYERISLEDRGGSYIAVACNRGSRVRVEVTAFGDIGPERVLGRCEECKTSTDCGVGKACFPRDHTCETKCTSAADCGGDAPLCDPL